MSAEENKAIVRRYLDEIWNKGNVDYLDVVAAPDYARYLVGQDQPLDRESQKRRLSGFLAALPDHRLTVEDLFAEGDRVVFRLTIRGTHQSTLLGVAPTGKSMTIYAIDITRLVDGKIVEHWGIMDTFNLRQQLGLQ